VRHNPIEDLHDVPVVSETDGRQLQAPFTFHIDFEWAVHKDIADAGVAEERLQRPKAQQIVEQFLRETGMVSEWGESIGLDRSPHRSPQVSASLVNRK